MKKIVYFALIGILALGCLSGCGTTKQTAAGGKTDLLIGLPGGDGVTEMRVVENFIAARQDKYNITTDEGSWGDFTKKVKLQFVSKNDVTPVFFTDSCQASSFGAQGALEPLNGYVEKLDESLYNGALRAVTDPDGNLWGVPHALNSIAMVYNKDIFDEKGVPYPEEDWTWQEMLDMAKTLTFDRDGDGEMDVYGIYYITNDTQGWLPFMYAYGVKPLTDDLRNSNLDDPKVFEAMNAYQKPVLEGNVPEPALIAAAGNMEAAFADGQLAMVLLQSSGLRVINEFKPDLNYDAQIMPIGWNGERSCIYVPNVWVIYNKASDDVKAASWDWISYYLNEESQLLIAETTPSGYPIMKKALDAVSTNGLKPEHKDAFYRGIDDAGKTMLENPCSSELAKVVNGMTTKIRNKEDVKTCIDEAHTGLQETLDYYYNQL